MVDMTGSCRLMALFGRVTGSSLCSGESSVEAAAAAAAESAAVAAATAAVVEAAVCNGAATGSQPSMRSPDDDEQHETTKTIQKSLFVPAEPSLPEFGRANSLLSCH